MAQVVKLKRTSVQGRIPSISNLELGELAINTHDGRIFFEKDDGTLSIQEILTTNSQNSGSFNLTGAISASSLEISGNANITGNLVLGGHITIGDASSDTIAFVGDISSSLIPDVTNVFDLGSTTRKFANVYATNLYGTINSTNGIVSGSSQIDVLETTNFNEFSSSVASTFSGLSTDYNDLQNIPSGIISSSAQIDTLFDIDGLVSSSTQIINLLPSGTISGSSQVTISDTTGFTSFSSSVDTSIQTEKERIDAILLSADADKDSFAEIVTLINSVDTTNDNAFASFYTSSNDRFDSFESFTSSIDTTIKTKLDSDGVISGSSQVVIGDTDGFTSFSSSVASTFDGLSSNYDDLVGIPSGIVSGSSQLTSSLDSRYLNVSGEGTISGSFIGSFSGDGSGLTGLSVDVGETTTVTSSFENQSTISVIHSFDSRNVLVSVYDTTYSQIIPQSITLTDNNTVDIVLSNTGSGHIVLAKGGHIVSGSQLEIDEIASINDTFTNQTSYTINHSFDTKNVFVSIYGTDDEQIIPALVSTPTTSSVQIGFDNPTSGRVVIGKAGHLVTASSEADFTQLLNIPVGIVSGSSQVTLSDTDGFDTFASFYTASNARFDSIEGYTSSLDITNAIITGSFTGSFVGDGSGLTGTSFTETFTSETSLEVIHNLDTKNVTVQVYDTDDYMIFPTSIRTTTTNTVDVVFNTPRSGRVVITR